MSLAHSAMPTQKAKLRGPKGNAKRRINLCQGSDSTLDQEDLSQLTRCILFSRSLVESETHSSTEQPTEVIDTFHVETMAARSVLSSYERVVGNMPTFSFAAERTRRMMGQGCTRIVLLLFKKRWTITSAPGTNIASHTTHERASQLTPLW